MLKLVTIIGTRPELIKMCRVIHELDEHFNHVLIHSGQNFDYELNEVFFQELDIRKPDYFLGISNESVSRALADIILKTDEILDEIKPDALLLYGDTNTCLSVIVAKRKKIPIFHMEAGNRCFDQRVPEEQNRKIVDHLSDINLVLTEHARQYLIQEGIPSHRIIKTGSHMEEVLDYYMPQIMASKALEQLNLSPSQFFVVSIHREENVDAPNKLQRLLHTLNSIASHYNYPIIVSTHPRTRKRLESLQSNEELHPLIIFNKPFGFLDYIALQMNAYCVISDSGTIFEESSLLNLPAITLRDAHERPEGMDEGTLIMSSIDNHLILDAIQITRKQYENSKSLFKKVKDYEGGAVSIKVSRIIHSYIDYINRNVWFKK